MQGEFLNLNGSGSNIIGNKNTFLFTNGLQKYFSLFKELSHRSSAFAKIIQDAERDIREIL